MYSSSVLGATISPFSSLVVSSATYLRISSGTNLDVVSGIPTAPSFNPYVTDFPPSKLFSTKFLTVS